MNWGDDINVYMFELITRKKVIPAAKLLFPHKKYAFIGSVIPACIDRNTTVWGSGCMDFEQPMGKISSTGAIKAVRGPKTREYLLKNGVECPEIYGDPALLLPKVYQPKDKTKKYKMTIIPHHHDWDKPEELKNYLHQYLPDAHVINMTDYKGWTDVIDEIVQSEIVYSSSLHGLITSDAYGIPNAFVELLYHHPKIDKYEDYYMSLQKIGSSKKRMIEPLKGDEMLLHKDELLNSFRPQKIDLQPLINACPLNLYIKNDEK
jgi:pyruvyltransferase